MIERLKYFFEKNAFGVSAKLADKTGISTGSVRLFFIYASFLAIGSPIIIYLSLAFLIHIRKHLRRRRRFFREF